MEKIDKQKLIECIEEEIESFPRQLTEYQRGAKTYNVALLKEIKSGRFDIQEEQTDDQ